jgi:AraC-like DNA-binding protein
MEAPPLKLDIFAVIIFLGVIQGLFLSYFFLSKKIRQKPSNLYLGFLMLTLSLVILEIHMVYTGYMYQVIWIDNFSEAFTFAISPLMYFYIYSSISGKSPKRVWIHMLPMFFWLIYSIWYFIYPYEIKQLFFIYHNYPDIPVEIPEVLPDDDPIGLRKYILELTMLQFLAYLIASLFYIKKSFKTLGISFFSSGISSISWLRNFIFLMFAVLISVGVASSYFEGDLGMYIVGSLISAVIYATSFNVIRSSDYFKENIDDPFHPKLKYEKSTLQDTEKELIIEQLKQCMEVDKEFKNNLVSLPSISKKLNFPVHHISQVINEKLGQTFFEMIAVYRIQEAKSILEDSSKEHLIIEEIAEEVGYNSKSAFNRSFKKIVGITPSEYKNKWMK